MTKRVLLIALAVLAVGFTACDNETDAVDPTPTVESGLDADTMDQLYLATVREGAPSFASIPDATLIELGEAVCTGLDSGATFAELITMGADSGLDNIDLGFTMGVGVGAYCPEYADQLA